MAGAYTNIEPSVPHHSCQLGIVTNVHANQGSILVNISQHKTLEELSDVNGTPLTTSGQLPVWDQTNGYFDFTKNINYLAGGSNTQIQYNNAGALAGDSNFTWNGTTLKLGTTVPGLAYTNKISINETAAQANHIIMHNNTTSGFGSVTLSNGSSWNNHFAIINLNGKNYTCYPYMSADGVDNQGMFLIHSQGLLS